MGLNLFRSLILLTCLMCLPVAAGAEPKSRTVAVVNGVSLSDADLTQEINVIMPMNQPFHGKLSADKMKKIRAEAMKNLVDYELRAQDARKKGIRISAAVLQAEMDKLAVKFKSKAGLEEAYKREGFTKKTFTRIMERRLLADKVLHVEVDDKVSVTPEKVKKQYTRNVAKYSKPEEYRASQIMLKVSPNSTQEEKTAQHKKAEALLKRIKAGEKFEELARKESDDLTKIKGGDLGYFHAGQSVEEFEAAIVKLKVGETSGIVETLYGYHIIKLTEKRAPRQIPFEEIKDKIRSELVEAEKKHLLQSWMDHLYKTAAISYPGAK